MLNCCRNDCSSFLFAVEGDGDVDVRDGDGDVMDLFMCFDFFENAEVLLVAAGNALFVVSSSLFLRFLLPFTVMRTECTSIAMMLQHVCINVR